MAVDHVSQPRRPREAEPAATGGRDDLVEQSRRRRKQPGALQGRMHVPPEMLEPGGALDPAKWNARWINDDSNRIHNLTKLDDWEVVTTDGQAGTVDSVGALKYPIGQLDGGGVKHAYLCRKLKVYADEDRSDRMKKADAALEAKRDAEKPEESYTPKR